VILTSILGLFIALGSSEVYTAQIKILPYRSTGVNISGLSGLANLAGIRLPSGSSEQLITAGMYPELANTIDFNASLVQTPLRFSGNDTLLTLYEYMELRQGQTSVIQTVFKYTFGLPGLIRE